MGTEYHYYLGYKNNKDGLIYPIGPYNCNGKLCSVEWHCSRDSDLKYSMNYLTRELCSEELLQDLLGKEINSWSDNDISQYLKWLPFDELPTGSPMRSGYYLIDEVIMYQDGKVELEDVFYDHLTPEAYAAKMANELVLGVPEDDVDCEGFPIKNHSANDYMHFTYIDEYCDEYICQQLRHEYSRLYDKFDFDHLDKDDIIPVVILLYS